MSILKFETRTPKSLKTMYGYLVAPTKTDSRGIFGIGVNPSYAVEEMTFVQQAFYKQDLTHPYVQVILSLGKNVATDLRTVRRLCEEVGKILVYDERQVFGAIHFKNTQYIHCHYLLNYVSVKGELYRQKVSLVTYKKQVNEILARYSLPITAIYYYGQGYDSLVTY